MIASSAWLWLLAAIAIPVAVHLWNRRPGSSELLGTFRFLPEQSFAKAGRIELHEVPLLFLRILLVLFVVLLLADLYWQSEKRTVNAVKISESEEVSSEQWVGDTVLEMRVPEETINSVGWWNLLEQLDYDLRPEQIFADGEFSTDRFIGDRPEIFADVNWEEAETDQDIVYRSDSWTGIDGNATAFVQRADGENRIKTIETLSGENAETSTSDRINLVINETVDSDMKRGIEYLGSRWNADHSEQVLEDHIIAMAVIGNRSVTLKTTGSAHNRPGVLQPGEINGVRMDIRVQDTTIYQSKALLHEARSRIPVLWRSSENELLLNAIPGKELSSWFYAGVAHQLLKMLVGVEELQGPLVSATQREPVTPGQVYKAENMQNESASGWLFLMLVTGWALERFIAARRGM